jgi:signal peptidase I
MSNSTFEDVIEKQGRLVYTNVGNSMYPFIKPRDLLVIEKVEKPLKKYDVPLYKRDSGKYVLHRIINVKSSEYLICGDNRPFVEHGITDRHIIGVLNEIIREGQTISVHSPDYKFYLRFLPFRRFKLLIKYCFKKIVGGKR